MFPARIYNTQPDAGRIVVIVVIIIIIIIII